MLAGGLLAVVVGAGAFRTMDDRPGVPLRSDLLGAWCAGGRAGAGFARRCSSPSRAARAPASRRRRGCSRRGCAAAGPRGRRDPRARRDAGRRAAARAAARPGQRRLAPRAEALLYAADRAQHVDQRRAARPSTAAPSSSPTATSTPRWPTRAPAGTLERRRGGAAVALGDRRRCAPTSSLLLDVDPAVGLARARRTGEPDRIEAGVAGLPPAGAAGLPRPGRRRVRSATSSSPPTSRRGRRAQVARARSAALVRPPVARPAPVPA